jgi:hypothetical protein
VAGRHLVGGRGGAARGRARRAAAARGGRRGGERATRGGAGVKFPWRLLRAARGVK